MKRLKMFSGLQRGNLCWLNQVALSGNDSLGKGENPSKQLAAILHTVNIPDLLGHILAKSNE